MEYFLRRRGPFEIHPRDFSVAVSRLTRNDTYEYRAFRILIILEERSDEESRSWQETHVESKNEMLRFAQHDIKGRASGA